MNCPLHHRPRRVALDSVPSPRMQHLCQNNKTADDVEIAECYRIIKEGQEDLASMTLHSEIRNFDLDEFTTATSGEVEQLLAAFHLPCLTSLVITGKVWDADPIKQCTIRSCCTLMRLKMPFVNHDGNFSVLLQTPQLQHLTHIP